MSTRKWIAGSVSLSPWTSPLWFGALFLAVVSIQIAVGAYRADLGNHSDEAAHFLNGLVLRDYLVTALGENPISFAQQYYLNYPKIAPLVWPPLFHVALAIVLLPRWSPHLASLLLVALIAATAAFRLSRFIGLFARPLAAYVLPLAFLGIPLIVDVESSVMVDIALAATGLEAAWWWCHYLVDRRLKHGILFGVWAACCCLTKGNGVAMVLVPPLAMAIAHAPELLKDKGLYAAAAIVLVFAGPFAYVSYVFCSAMGDFTAGTPYAALNRLNFYVTTVWQQLTAPAAALALLGSAGVIWARPSGTWSLRTAAPVSLLALGSAGVLFHTVLPLQFPDARYLVLSFGPMLALVPLGAALLAHLTPASRRALVTNVLVVVAAAGVVALSRPLPVRQSLGFKEVVDAVSIDRLAGQRVLVVSDEYGEGAFIGEVALRGPEPRAVIIRASKLLIEEDWMHGHVKTLYTTPENTLINLQDLHAEYLVFDRSPESQSTPFWSHVQAMVNSRADEFEPLVTGQSPPVEIARTIDVYRLRHLTPGPAKDLPASTRQLMGQAVAP